MKGRRLQALFERHGGVKAIHTHPFRGGWANTAVCRDGFTYTQTKEEDQAINAFLATLD